LIKQLDKKAQMGVRVHLPAVEPARGDQTAGREVAGKKP